MKKVRSSELKKASSSEVYTYSSNGLATVVDKQTMKEIQHDLDNPVSGTASLNKLLKELECAK